MAINISRRAALLGGFVLAVNGAVLWIRNRRPQIENEDYEVEWNDLVRRLDVPVGAANGPQEFVLDYRPVVGEKFRVLTLYGAYKNGQYPEPPNAFYLMQGVVTVVPAIESIDNQTALLINADDSQTRTRFQDHDTPGGVFAAVPGVGGEFNYFKMNEDKGYVEVATADVALPCLEVGASLEFDYPKGKKMAQGDKWTIPKTSVYCVDLTCQIDGFAEVVGRNCVKVTAKQALNKKETLAYIAYQNGAIKLDQESGDEPSEFDPDAVADQEIQLAKREGQTMSWDVQRYVDLETGLTVRQEFRKHTTSANGSTRSSVTMSQMLPHVGSV